MFGWADLFFILAIIFFAIDFILTLVGAAKDRIDLKAAGLDMLALALFLKARGVQ